MSIKETLQKIMEEKMGGHGSRLCSVLSVSGTTCDVQTLDDEVKIIGARLQTEDSNGVLLTPKVGSFVVVTPITDFEFVVVMYSAIDSIKFLDGSFGGLIKITDLVTKVNNLENQVNSILSILKATTIPLAPSGTYPFATLYAALSSLTNTIVSDIENNKITHGTI